MRFITIDEDRYGGAYSDAAFTAWEGNAPDEISEGDGSCEKFWAGTVPLHGKGATAVEALKDFLSKSEAWIGAFDVVDIGSGKTPKDRFLVVWSARFAAWWPDSDRDT